jgi:hypothetical protein
MRGKISATKPSDVVSPNLRIKEGLRRRLAREAERNQTTLNKEMARRLEQSFDVAPMRSLEQVATDITKSWARLRERVEA